MKCRGASGCRLHSFFLEPDAKTELDLPGLVGLARQNAEIGWVADLQERIAQLDMVEDVGEDGREFGTDPLRNVDRLAHAEVDIPVGHSAENAGAAGATRVQTQDWAAKQVVGGYRIGEQIGTEAVGADTVRAENVVVARTALRVVPEAMAFSPGVPMSVPFKKLMPSPSPNALPLADTVDCERYPACRRQHRSKGPATEDASCESFLALEERRLVHEEHVVDEFTVP